MFRHAITIVALGAGLAVSIPAAASPVTATDTNPVGVPSVSRSLGSDGCPANAAGATSINYTLSWNPNASDAAGSTQYLIKIYVEDATASAVPARSVVIYPQHGGGLTDARTATNHIPLAGLVAKPVDQDAYAYVGNASLTPARGTFSCFRTKPGNSVWYAAAYQSSIGAPLAGTSDSLLLP